MSTKKFNHNCSSSIFYRTRRVAPAKTSDNCEGHFEGFSRIKDLYLESCEKFIIVPHLQELKEPRSVETAQMPASNFILPRYKTFVPYQSPKSSRSNDSPLGSARSSATYVIESNTFLTRSENNLSLDLEAEYANEEGLLHISQPDLNPSLSDFELDTEDQSLNNKGTTTRFPIYDQDEGTIGDSLLHGLELNKSCTCIDIPEHPGPDGEIHSTKKCSKFMKCFRRVFRNFSSQQLKIQQAEDSTSISHRHQVEPKTIRHPKYSVSERLRNGFTSNSSVIRSLFRKKPELEPPLFDDDEFWVNN